ncbi:hypothetical protein BC833DRAFT_626226 [Globomyces pollinis-pini]|nr:hypothetical protein BC833DRAFT_626226 [Globomyces pollinis-pini]
MKYIYSKLANRYHRIAHQKKMTDLYISDDIINVIEVLPWKQLYLIQNYLNIGNIGIVRIKGKRLTGKQALLRVLKEKIAEDGSTDMMKVLRAIPSCFCFNGLSNVNVLGFKTQLQRIDPNEHLLSTNIYLFKDLDVFKFNSQFWLYFSPAIANMERSPLEPLTMNCCFPPNCPLLISLKSHQIVIKAVATFRNSFRST